jgi:predicted nucleotidyltransferase
LSARRLLRRVVLATSVPPLLGIYRLAYAAATRLALRRFRRIPGVRAVYLTRGGAARRALPLLSDLDFAVVVRGLEPAARRELLESYGRLAGVTSLLDRSLGVFDEDELRRLHATNDYFAYRFTEGKRTWRLLHGTDVVRRLPELPEDALQAGYRAELPVWWANFCWRLLHDRRYADEPATRRYTCFKALAEVLKMERALDGRGLVTDRREALELALPELEDADRRVAELLLSLARRRFRGRAPDPVEATTGVLLRRLDAIHGRLETHPLGRSTVPLAEVDAPAAEAGWTARETAHVETLLERVRRWPGYRGAALVAGVWFNLDERLLLVRVDPARLPPPPELTGLWRVHRGGDPLAVARVRPFLLLPNAGFQLDPEDLTRSWQSIVSRAASPEVFALLDRPECVLEGALDDGPAGARARPAGWTPLLERFLREEADLFHDLLRDPAVYKLDDLDALRVVWKTAQLLAANRSAALGEPRVPLTPPAVTRALRELDLPVPAWAEPLGEAYRRALATGDGDAGDLVPAALRWLAAAR